MLLCPQISHCLFETRNKKKKKAGGVRGRCLTHAGAVGAGFPGWKFQMTSSEGDCEGAVGVGSGGLGRREPGAGRGRTAGSCRGAPHV